MMFGQGASMIANMKIDILYYDYYYADPWLFYLLLGCFFIVLLCLYLEFEFANREYQFICGRPHKMCNRCCKRIAEKNLPPLQPQGYNGSVELVDREHQIQGSQHVAKRSKHEQSTSGLSSSDLLKFAQTHSECGGSGNTEGVTTDHCSSLHRICRAFQYIAALETRDDLIETAKKSLFVEFTQNVYSALLDDSIHLIQKHSNDILQIQREWTSRFGFKECSVSDCTQTSRHFTSRRSKRNAITTIDDDGVYRFYRSLFDRLHFYVFHLYEVGLRVEAVDVPIIICTDEMNAQNVEDWKEVEVDEVFAAERDLISSRVRKLVSDLLDDGNSKFMLQTVHKRKGRTFRDAVVQNLAEHSGIQMDVFLDENAFDSDAIAMDLEDVSNSTLYQVVQQMLIIENIINFIRSVNLRRHSFSTGFTFDYWNESNEMYVKPRNRTLREEVVESGSLTMKKWLKLVLVKAETYLKTTAVRKVVAKGRTFPKGAAVTLQHLLAIILYCDFSDLCTEFSETFRVEDVFESVESVKVRHSAFAIFGKLLVELVLEFGTDGKDRETGPFFTGINCVLNIGSFAICLKGPCSTSTVKEVAVRFAGQHGMILKLCNDSLSAQYQCCFDCSWISNYIEEAERLWIAGDVPLRIMSIVMVQTAKNYGEKMGALYLFDSMISGVLLGDEMKVTRSHYNVLSKLIDLEMNGNIEAAEFDEYLVSEWTLFVQRKEEIILDLQALDKSFKLLSNLIMYNVQYNWSGKAIGNDNVLKTEWLSIFPSLRTASVLTAGKSYKFRLEALEKVVDGLPQSVTLMVFDKGHWAKNAMNKAYTDWAKIHFGWIGWDIKYSDDLRMAGHANGNMKGFVVKRKK